MLLSNIKMVFHNPLENTFILRNYYLSRKIRHFIRRNTNLVDKISEEFCTSGVMSKNRNATSGLKTQNIYTGSGVTKHEISLIVQSSLGFQPILDRYESTMYVINVCKIMMH